MGTKIPPASGGGGSTAIPPVDWESAARSFAASLSTSLQSWLEPINFNRPDGVAGYLLAGTTTGLSRPGGTIELDTAAGAGSAAYVQYKPGSTTIGQTVYVPNALQSPPWLVIGRIVPFGAIDNVTQIHVGAMLQAQGVGIGLGVFGDQSTTNLTLRCYSGAPLYAATSTPIDQINMTDMAVFFDGSKVTGFAGQLLKGTMTDIVEQPNLQQISAAAVYPTVFVYNGTTAAVRSVLVSRLGGATGISQ